MNTTYTTVGFGLILSTESISGGGGVQKNATRRSTVAEYKSAKNNNNSYRVTFFFIQCFCKKKTTDWSLCAHSVNICSAERCLHAQVPYNWHLHVQELILPRRLCLLTYDSIFVQYLLLVNLEYVLVCLVAFRVGHTERCPNWNHNDVMRADSPASRAAKHDIAPTDVF